MARVGARPRKIPPESRRRPIDFAAEPSRLRRIGWRLREDSQFLRSAVQLAFALLCAWIGIEFALFVAWGTSSPGNLFVARPPGAEGFLPISALISLNYWIQTGSVNTVHPAALAILTAILALSIFLKKSFCSWLCPVGTISEALWSFGQRLFGRNVRLPRWLDAPLRGLKYLLLSFFLWSILRMDVGQLAAFINSPYNKMADVKMYLFFARISSVALWTILTLAFLSLVIKNFWCRFLCPYGALLGMVGWLSPLKITRTADTCVDCELCSRACPSSIAVHAVRRVWSDECTSCLACVEACPVKDTLAVRSAPGHRAIPAPLLGGILAGIFIAVTGLAMLTGHWQNAIGREEYRRRMQTLDSPMYQHFQGRVPAYGPND